MRNDAMFVSRDDFNPFTEEVKSRCKRDGKCLVKLREGQWREIVYAKDELDKRGEASFHTEDWDFVWNNDGSSSKCEDFDMVEIK